MSEESIPVSKRSRYNKSELMHMVREDLVEKFLKLQNQLDYMTAKQLLPNEELNQCRESNTKMRSQLQESTQREGILVMRLTNKEQEVQELMTQIQEMKQAQNPGSVQLHTLFLDPAVNLMFQQIKKELDNGRHKLEQAQDELAALKFTPDSQIGKRLIVKCRLLLQENEEIGRMISSGSIAKLEADIALEKQLIQQMKSTESETEIFLEELDEEMEGLQATIYTLQQQLQDSREQLRLALEENGRLKSAKSTNLRDTSCSPLVVPSESETLLVCKAEMEDDGVSSTQVSADDAVCRRTSEVFPDASAAPRSGSSHLKRRSSGQTASGGSRSSTSRRKLDKSEKHGESSRMVSSIEKEKSSAQVDRHAKQGSSAADVGRVSDTSESRTKSYLDENEQTKASVSKTGTLLEVSNGLVSMHCGKTNPSDDFKEK